MCRLVVSLRIGSAWVVQEIESSDKNRMRRRGDVDAGGCVPNPETDPIAGDQTGHSREPLTGKAATQDRILVAATDLFLTRGYETTTIAQVAEQASVSRATVFWHFSDKESLFRECFNRICEPFRDSLARDFSSLPPEKRLEEQVELYQSFVADHRQDVEGFIRWAMEHTSFRDWLIRTIFDLHQRFGGVLTESIAEIVPPNRDPHAIAMAVLILLDGGFLLSYFDTTSRFAETRQASVRSILEMIPRRAPDGS
jgi:AcrR family transcriptional regulator